jgi:hypothetical protein
MQEQASRKQTLSDIFDSERFNFHPLDEGTCRGCGNEPTIIGDTYETLDGEHGLHQRRHSQVRDVQLGGDGARCSHQRRHNLGGAATSHRSTRTRVGPRATRHAAQSHPPADRASRHGVAQGRRTLVAPVEAPRTAEQLPCRHLRASALLQGLLGQLRCSSNASSPRASRSSQSSRAGVRPRSRIISLMNASRDTRGLGMCARAK